MPRRIRIALVLGVLTCAACAAPARGQGLAAHLPHGPSLRPLHERLALADAVAIGTIRAVEPGRIQVEAATPLLGGPGESFALKRAPSRPPPLEGGERVLLFLRGARSPYLLLDRPEELRVLADAAAEARWREAIAALQAADSPAALRDLYLAWLFGAHADLRDAARLGLESREAPFAPLAPEVGARLVDAAVDASLEAGPRRAAAAVALARAGTASALLERLAVAAPSEDPEVLRAALGSGALLRLPELEPLLARALVDPRPEVRATAAELGRLAANSALARPALEHMAAEDPQDDLRRQAQQALSGR